MKDINAATKEELAQVPLISPARADSIIEWRYTHGRISDMAELMSIPGIGERTLQRITKFFSASAEQDDQEDQGQEATEDQAESHEAHDEHEAQEDEAQDGDEAHDGNVNGHHDPDEAA